MPREKSLQRVNLDAALPRSGSSAGEDRGRGAVHAPAHKPAARDVVIRIGSLLPSFAPAEQRVARLAIDDPGAVAALTISELAERAQTSGTTVLRFCRAIGLDGYPALRIALASAAGHGTSSWGAGSGDIEPDDTPDQIIQKTGHADARAIADTVSQLDANLLCAVVDKLLSARRIDLYGVGASGLVALDLQQKLHRLGKGAYAWTDRHMALISAANLGSHDLAVAISHSGTTDETYEPSRLAVSNGAALIAITNHPRSRIARLATIVLTTAARETFRTGATTSRLAQLAVIDCLIAVLAQRAFHSTLDAAQQMAPTARPHHKTSSK